MMSKIPHSEINAWQERTGLSDKEILRILEIEPVTWDRWKTTDLAPSYFRLAMIYVEQNPGQFRTVAAKPRGQRPDANNSASRKRNLTLAERFAAKAVWLENGCLEWRGAHTFSISKDQSCSPRKAAWLVKNGMIPENDIKTTCGNDHCVNIDHLQLGRESKAGKKNLTEAKKGAILLELMQGAGARELERKYKVSRVTITKMKNNMKEGQG